MLGGIQISTPLKELKYESEKKPDDGQKKLYSQIDIYRQQLKEEKQQNAKRMETLQGIHVDRIREIKQEFSEQLEQQNFIMSTAMNHGLLDRIRDIHQQHEENIQELKHKIQQLYEEKGNFGTFMAIEEIHQKHVKLYSVVGTKEHVLTDLRNENHRLREDLKLMTQKYEKAQHECDIMVTKYNNVDIDELYSKFRINQTK